MRKNILILFCFFIAIPAFAQKNLDIDSVGYLENIRAKILKINQFYVIVPNNDNSKRFLAKNLDEYYKTDKLEVVVSGIIGKLPTNAKALATPFKIIEIKKDDTPIDDPNIINKTANFNYNQKFKKWQIGQVKLVKNNVFGIQVGSQLYIPQNLPDKFKYNKIVIKFKGIAGEIPKGIRMTGKPLKIKRVIKLDIEYSNK